MITNQIQEYISSHNEQQFAIHCETEEKAIELLKILAELGFIWSVNAPLLNGEEVDTRWYNKKAKTCYTFTPGSNILLTARKEFYANKGIDIISYDDFINQFSQINDKFIDVAVGTEYNSNIETVVDINEINREETISQEYEIKAEEPEYMYCTNCGNKIRKKSKFCFGCGSMISHTEDAKKKETSNMPYYDKKIIEGNTAAMNNGNNVIESLSAENFSIESPTTKMAPSKPLIDEVVTSLLKDDDTSVTQKNTESKARKQGNKESNQLQNLIYNYLGIKPYEKFQVIGPKNNYYNKTIYRFNDKGFREKEVAPGVWFLCNDEQELLYVINNGTNAIKICK